MKFLSGYSPDDPKPLGGYAGLSAVWGGAVTAFVVAQRRAGRPLPQRVPVADLALLTAGTYKLSRLITKDRVMAFARAPFTRYQGDAERPSEVARRRAARACSTRSASSWCAPTASRSGSVRGCWRRMCAIPDLARSAAMLLTIVAGSRLFLHQAWAAVDERA